MALAMDHPFREMDDVLGESEREAEAIRAYGRWRLRLRTWIVASFVIGGLVPMGLAYYGALQLQFSINGYALLYINALAAIGAWLAMIGIGAFLSKRIVRARSAAKLAELSKGYEIAVATLAETVDMANNLDR